MNPDGRIPNPDYPIHFGNMALARLFAWLPAMSFSSISVVCDENTFQHCYPILKRGLPSHHLQVVGAGDLHKNPGSAQKLWTEWKASGMDRSSLVIALGGGMVCDLAGFSASVYMRGIPFVYVPTTLLAQVDASVGGKTGVDLNNVKNIIGTFSKPEGVFIWTDFLKTLSPRELKSGFAEVIKHGLIKGGDYWNKISGLSELPESWNDIVAESIAVKLEIVQKDPKEKRERKILNFGHTIGHAIESWSLDHRPEKPMLHGEAVAAGMICELFLCKEKFSFPDADRGAGFIQKHFPVPGFGNDDISEIIPYTRADKKNQAGIISPALLSAPGQHEYSVPVSETEIQSAMQKYLDL